MKQKISGSKFKKAQHIVELVLIAPFIIFFIGIVYQIAIAIHTNYKFNASVYEAISFMAFQNKIIQDEETTLTSDELKEKTVNNIKSYARILLNERKALGSNSLEIDFLNTGDVDFLIGMYKFTSTFNLFNNTKLNPKAYDYITIIPVNSAILRKNSFEISNDFFNSDYEMKPLDDLSEDKEDTPPEDTEDASNSTQEDTKEETDTSNTESVEIPEVNF